MPTEQEWEKIKSDKQKRIDKAISSREKSIAYFNSVNSAIALVGERYKQPTKNKQAIIYWRDWFYDQWRDWYMEGVVVEPAPKRTAADYAQAKEEAPIKQEEQNVADTLKGEEIKIEDNFKQQDAEEEYAGTPLPEKVESPKDII